MFEIKNAIATPLEDLDLVVEAFHKATVLALDEVVGDLFPPNQKQFQEILETVQATMMNLLDPPTNFGLSLLLGYVHVEDRSQLFA